MYQFASVTRWGRNTGPRAALITPRPSQPPPVPVRLVRAAAIGVGEGCFLLTLDVIAVAAVSYAAGSSWAALLIRAAATALGLCLAGLYRARLQFSVLDDLPRLLIAVSAVAAAWLTWPGETTVRVLAVWAAALVAAVVAGRVVGYRMLRRHRKRTPGRATIVVGSGHLALRLADALREDRTYGLMPVGFVGPQTLTQPKIPVLAPAAELERAVIKYKPMHLIVAFPGPPDADLVGTLRRCRRYGVTVYVVPRLFELAVGVPGRRAGARHPAGPAAAGPARMRRWAVKRAIDVVGAADRPARCSPRCCCLRAGRALGVRPGTGHLPAGADRHATASRSPS